jgi:hypothetical protein
MVFITNKVGDLSNLKSIPFRDILGTRKFDSSDIFILETKDRNFELHCYSNYDRDMWIVGFDYLIKSTIEVQKIIDSNNRDSKMKE